MTERAKDGPDRILHTESMGEAPSAAFCGSKDLRGLARRDACPATQPGTAIRREVAAAGARRKVENKNQRANRKSSPA
jgi:hypothetical protein